MNRLEQDNYNQTKWGPMTYFHRSNKQDDSEKIAEDVGQQFAQGVGRSTKLFLFTLVKQLTSMVGAVSRQLGKTPGAVGDAEAQKKLQNYECIKGQAEQTAEEVSRLTALARGRRSAPDSLEAPEETPTRPGRGL